LGCWTLAYHGLFVRFCYELCDFYIWPLEICQRWLLTLKPIFFYFSDHWRNWRFLLRFFLGFFLLFFFIFFFNYTFIFLFWLNPSVFYKKRMSFLHFSFGLFWWCVYHWFHRLCLTLWLLGFSLTLWLTFRKIESYWRN